MSAGLSQGAHTFTVPLRLFSQNRERLCRALKEVKVAPSSVVLLQGGEEQLRYNTDAMDLAFRQVGIFFRLSFGRKFYSGILFLLDIRSAGTGFLSRSRSGYWEVCFVHAQVTRFICRLVREVSLLYTDTNKLVVTLIMLSLCQNLWSGSFQDQVWGGRSSLCG